MAESGITNSELRKYNDLGRNVTLIGVVIKEPDVREKSTKLTLRTENLLEAGPLTASGNVLLTVNKYPQYQYGDRLKVVGELKSPSQDIEGFNYKNYLKKDGIYSLVNFPEIELIEKNQGNPLFAKILTFKEKLKEIIYQNLSPPQSSILGAIILGDKKQLSEGLKTKLNVAGLRHVTAVSGLHVTVLSSILMSFLIWLGFWRKQAFYFAIFLIALFVLMTGLQASAVRAGIMGGLFLFAQYLGRLNTSSRTIVFAAAVMLAFNPFLLGLDVGFQLSFLAILGIIYLLPTFQNWLRFIPWENPKSILSMTFSAYLFTLPILIYNFGYVSLVSPITNLLVVPFLYWIMLFGFIFGLAGMIFQPLALILSFPVWLLLTYLTKVIDWFSEIPWSSLGLENVHWAWLIAAYLILGLIIWLKKEGERLKFIRH